MSTDEVIQSPIVFCAEDSKHVSPLKNLKKLLANLNN